MAGPGTTRRNIHGEEKRIEWTDVVTVQPIGGSMPIEPIAGFDGLVSDFRAAAKEISDAAKEMRIVADRTLQMQGTRSTVDPAGEATGGITQQGLVDALRTVITEQEARLKQEVATPQGRNEDAPGEPSDWVPGPGRTFAGTVPPAPAAGDDPRTPPTEEIRGETPPAPEGSGQERARTPQEEFEYRRRMFGGPGKLSISKDLRSRLGERVEARLSQAQWGDQLVEAPWGGWYHQGGDPDDPNVLGAEASDRDVAGFMRRRAIMAAARQGAAALGQGATFGQAGLAAIPAAAKFAGYAGAAAHVINEVGNFAESQRAANAQWRRMQGGSNADAFLERGRQSLFSQAQFGVMGSGDAARLYQMVAATGMDREERGIAQNFALQNYRSMGMTIEQSMRIVNTASKTGQESLMGVADALKRVTESARDAGVNTEQARENFVGLWEQVSTSIGGGPGATALAGGVATTGLSLGRQYADANFAGIFSEETMRMVGARQGISRDQVIAAIGQEGGAGAYGDAVTAATQEYIRALMPPQADRIIQEELANVENPQSLTQAERDRIENRLLAEGGMDRAAIRAALEGQLGFQVSEDDVYGMMIGAVTGEVNFGEDIREFERSSETYELTDTRSKKDLANAVAGGDRDALDLRDQEGTYAYLEKKVRDAHSDVPWRDRKDKAMADKYLEYVRETGEAGGIAEAIATGGNPVHQMVKKVAVQTTEGERIVSLREAMEHFTDQIQRGDVEVVEGDKAGDTLAAAFGMAGDRNFKVTSDQKDELAKKGESPEDAERGGVNGTVTVVPHPSLRGILELQTQGRGLSVSPYDDLSPPASHVTPNYRPSGG